MYALVAQLVRVQPWYLNKKVGVPSSNLGGGLHKIYKVIKVGIFMKNRLGLSIGMIGLVIVLVLVIL